MYNVPTYSIDTRPFSLLLVLVPTTIIPMLGWRDSVYCLNTISYISVLWQICNCEQGECVSQLAPSPNFVCIIDVHQCHNVRTLLATVLLLQPARALLRTHNSAFHQILIVIRNFMRMKFHIQDFCWFLTASALNLPENKKWCCEGPPVSAAPQLQCRGRGRGRAEAN